MNQDSKLDADIRVAFVDNEYLRGDDCRSTKMYLLGWIGSVFRRREGRPLSEVEKAHVLRQIKEF